MQTPAAVGPNGEGGYGLGWEIDQQPHGSVLSHEGDQARYSSDLTVIPALQSGIVVLTARNGVLVDQGAAHDAGVAALTGARPGEPGTAFARVHGLLNVGAVALLALLSAWTVSAVNRSLRSVSPARVLRHAIVPALLGSFLAATFWSAVFALLGLSAGFEGFLPLPITFASAPDITVVVVLTTLLIAARGILPALSVVIRRRRRR